MTFLETPRLRLRNITEQDAAEMFCYRNHPLCQRYQRGQTRDLPGIAALCAQHQQDTLSLTNPALLAVALRDTDQMIGEIVVMPEAGIILLGYTVSYQVHRQGYATEALRGLIHHLRQVDPTAAFVCLTDPENAASQGLLKKIGYTDLGYFPAENAQVFGLGIPKDTVWDYLQKRVP